MEVLGTAELSNVRQFVAWYLKKNKISISGQGQLHDALNRDSAGIFDTLWLDYIQSLAAHNAELRKNKRPEIRGFTEQNCEKALSEACKLAIVDHRKVTTGKIKCTTENLEPLKAWVKAITGKDNAPEVAIMAHWLQLVKNKINNKPCKNIMMPIFVGRQGSGKTEAINRLIAPFSNYVLVNGVTQIIDPSYQLALNNNFIAFCDELAGAARADIQSLKRLITTENNDVRIFHTQRVEKVKQNAVFIGASNMAINEQIFDTTGARRFFQINTLDKADWATINSIDYAALWQGISEETDYLAPHMDYIAKEQEELATADENFEFFAEFNIKPTETKDLKDIPVNQVYRTYQQWAVDSGLKPMNKITFSKKLANRGLKSVVKRIKDKTLRIYSINKDAHINEIQDFAPFTGTTITPISKWS